VAVVCAGVYGPKTSGLEPPTEGDFDAVMRTNVLGPMRVIPQLADALAQGAKLVVISSRMGSIGARTNPGGWLYRASKAAVNSVLKDASLVLDGQAVCVSFHPGWVRTDMGGAGADLAPEQSVSDMRRVIAGLTKADHGRFLNHDGSIIPW
jgi:NAD(P)-dependent dehydrogenase (short-subunit alcohol dehydrogenase family)